MWPSGTTRYTFPSHMSIFTGGPQIVSDGRFWGHLGPSWPSQAQPGSARLGPARLGSAIGSTQTCLARVSSALPGLVRLGSAWLCH